MRPRARLEQTHNPHSRLINPDQLASTLLCLVGDHIAFANSEGHYLTSEKTRIDKVEDEVWLRRWTRSMKIQAV